MTTNQVVHAIEDEQFSCDECEAPMELDFEGQDTDQMTAIIRQSGWFASAGCGRILCHPCAKEWGEIP